VTGLLEAFLLPLYQDLDGVSRADEVARVGRIARGLAPPSRELELLIHFHVLGRWLDKVGNLSRTILAVRDVTEAELRRTSASIARLDAPESEVERAVVAARLIAGAGVRGLAERLARARREGMSVLDVARAARAEHDEPVWLSDEARAMLRERRQVRDQFCDAILAE
jgi:hypothetical protein